MQEEEFGSRRKTVGVNLLMSQTISSLFLTLLNQGLYREGDQAWSPWVPSMIRGQSGLKKDLLSEREPIPELTQGGGASQGTLS